ncbi:uncharacterized protein TRIADDRAFT_58201 [Trichoplax adhaerens]|uniref:RIM zinc finger domain-containing protein n=1 Tax=Trichoplax adhaerens TaxID=10228 RepID=B3S154_TRIAD|nr:hypothetical protein TRIADDRAFT_58201 [Trichoplax adhaerens]EDV23178.1 hypothetical protein TRIADDRAFT_58201 [Trichoplax adhaerens]|eukprot:XP_002114088.1 hypothetical protein TRIADDRAFT_58201 [Trichoplax adhaerens]
MITHKGKNEKLTLKTDSKITTTIIKGVKDKRETASNLKKEVNQYDQAKPVREKNICGICRKTKFAEGGGNHCKFCDRRVCKRCGKFITNKKQEAMSDSIALKNILKPSIFA